VILFTGCGRSGTKYVADLMTLLGLDIKHEKIGKDGLASFFFAVDADRVPYGPIPNVWRDKIHLTLHQVRHPLKVIASSQTFRFSWDFIIAHSPCKKGDPMLLNCAKYWYYWNLEAEKRSSWTWQIENIVFEFDELCKRVGVKPNDEALDSLPRNVNTREHGDVGWEEIESLDKDLCNKIKDLAMRYGYLK